MFSSSHLGITRYLVESLVHSKVSYTTNPWLFWRSSMLTNKRPHLQLGISNSLIQTEAWVWGSSARWVHVPVEAGTREAGVCLRASAAPADAGPAAWCLSTAMAPSSGDPQVHTEMCWHPGESRAELILPQSRRVILGKSHALARPPWDHL